MSLLQRTSLCAMHHVLVSHSLEMAHNFAETFKLDKAEVCMYKHTHTYENIESTENISV